jgi:hypothetical protein
MTRGEAAANLPLRPDLHIFLKPNAQ